MTEEDFLLKSLKEAVNIWSKGNGEAKFDLAVKDGVAQLKFEFQLGLPSTPHPPLVHPHPLYPHQHQEQQNQPRKRRM